MPKVKITTNVDSEIFKQMKIRAIEEDMNVGDLLEKAFNFYMNNSTSYNVKNDNLDVPTKTSTSTEDLRDIVLASLTEFFKENENYIIKNKQD